MFTLHPVSMQLLLALYNSPQRHYHDLNHIYFCLAKLDECIHPMNLNKKSVKVLTTAIWFHDAFYCPYPLVTSNERESAELFYDMYTRGYVIDPVEEVTEFNLVFEDTVTQAILATEFHLENDTRILPDHRYKTTDIMLDIDMAGFAKPFELALGDSELIFKEYVFLGYPKEKMMEARISFLEKVLAKDRIYRTNYFYETHEKKARDNIEAIIEVSKNQLAELTQGMARIL